MRLGGAAKAAPFFCAKIAYRARDFANICTNMIARKRVDDLIEQIAASLGIPAEMPLQAENRMRMEVRKECEGSIREKYLSELREEIAGIKEQTEKLLEPGIVGVKSS